jgi:CRISPR-associated endonuclease/helicase Cas3
MANRQNKYWAHTKTNPDGTPAPQADWEPLFTPIGTDPEKECQGEDCKKCQSLEPRHGHLNKVAYWTSKFAGDMFPEGPDREAATQWGYLAGLWHDLGKFSQEFQTYIAKAGGDSHAGESQGKVDHSTAGAQHAIKTFGPLGHWLAYGIAGHHSGLLDGESNLTCQRTRLGNKTIPNTSSADPQVTSQKSPPVLSFIAKELSHPSKAGFGVSFFTRMLFSCLVDADFLATESFMQPGQTKQRNQIPPDFLADLEHRVERRLAQFGEPENGDTVHEMRWQVATDCRATSKSEPGLFTLTVPTGGGKTLSSLVFAAKHARQHEQNRIIYVVPFTSIIEQNAEVIREIVSPLESAHFTALIEHHSVLSPDKETSTSRLASENWDAPIVITTAVQFYESLYAAKTSKSRKLHHIANSVVILDEAQSLPVHLLEPCLKVLQELAHHYHTSILLCTATQPAIEKNENNFPIGLVNCREIVRDKGALFEALKRVKVVPRDLIPDAQLSKEILSKRQALCIVNRRKHAQELFQRLGVSEEHFHLSALMCPEHRSRVIKQISDRLKSGSPTRVISTQLIEAGVDVDFPIVYRALAGLDSIAQAAGRCNRHGKLSAKGITYVFKPEDQESEQFIRETAQVAHQLLDLYDDLLSEEAIRHYFDLYYFKQKHRWDERDIMDCFQVNPKQATFPLQFQFKEAASRFNLIDSWQQTVLVPYDEKAKKSIQDLRNPALPLHRNLVRQLQRYSVQISPQQFTKNKSAFESLRDDTFQVLISPELNYSRHFGVNLDEEHANEQSLVI